MSFKVNKYEQNIEKEALFFAQVTKYNSRHFEVYTKEKTGEKGGEVEYLRLKKHHNVRAFASRVSDLFKLVLFKAKIFQVKDPRVAREAFAGKMSKVIFKKLAETKQEIENVTVEVPGEFAKKNKLYFDAFLKADRHFSKIFGKTESKGKFKDQYFYKKRYHALTQSVIKQATTEKKVVNKAYLKAKIEDISEDLLQKHPELKSQEGDGEDKFYELFKEALRPLVKEMDYEVFKELGLARDKKLFPLILETTGMISEIWGDWGAPELENLSEQEQNRLFSRFSGFALKNITGELNDDVHSNEMWLRCLKHFPEVLYKLDISLTLDRAAILLEQGEGIFGKLDKEHFMALLSIRSLWENDNKTSNSEESDNKTSNSEESEKEKTSNSEEENPISSDRLLKVFKAIDLSRWEKEQLLWRIFIDDTQSYLALLEASKGKTFSEEEKLELFKSAPVKSL